MEKAKFTTLDGLRGFAALAVMSMHFADHPILLAGYNIFSYADLAVDVFFVLSGFVIAYAYDRRFAAGMPTGSFMLARAIRLYPFYFVGTLMTVGLNLFLRWRGYYAHTPPLTDTFLEIGLSFLFVPQVIFGHYYPLNPPAWSLLFEVIANWIYRVLFPWMKRPVLLGIMAISLFGLWWFGFVTPQKGMNSIFPDFARVGFSFFAGVLIFRFWNATTFRPRVSPWLVALGLLVLLRFDFGLASFMLAVVLVYLGACTEPVGWSRRVFSALGDVSYGVYMLHYSAMMLSLIVIPKMLPSPSNLAPWTGLGLMVIVLGLAALLDRYYDRPLRRWLSALKSRDSEAVAGPYLPVSRLSSEPSRIWKK